MGARLMRALTFTGSHGALTACAVSGHVIEADACDCEDCAAYGDYRSVALVDVGALDPDTVRNGGGDILAAALVYRDGGYCPPMGWADDGEGGGFWIDPPPALPAPVQPHGGA